MKVESLGMRHSAAGYMAGHYSRPKHRETTERMEQRVRKRVINGNGES